MIPPEPGAVAAGVHTAKIGYAVLVAIRGSCTGVGGSGAGEPNRFHDWVIYS